jgi:hypothetical protein
MSDETKKVDDGGSAFPDIRNAIDWKYQPGMTLRDYFAGMALQVITKNISLEDFVSLQPQELADGAFKIADSMIRAGKVEK